MFNYAPVAFIIIDAKREVLAFNLKARQIFGKKIEFLHKPFFAFFSQLKDTHSFEKWIKSNIGEKYTLKIKDSEKNFKWLDLYCVNSRFKGKDAVLISAIDVTSEKKYFDTVLNIINIQKTISIVTNGKKLIFANNEFLSFLNYDSLEDFLKEHNCICEKFEDIEGFFHLGLAKNIHSWLDDIQELPAKDRLVAIRNANNDLYYFTVRITDFQEDKYVVTFIDVTDTINERYLLKDKVYHDSLTGVFSREFFNENISRIKKHFEQDSSKVGIGFIDIDDFKYVNDNYGHDVGDIALKNLANLLQDKTRENDYVIRWGGEEFILLLKLKNENSLYNILENIRVEIENAKLYDFEYLTCSIGGSVCLDDDIQKSIKVADDMMYKVKKNGKNRVIVSI